VTVPHAPLVSVIVVASDAADQSRASVQSLYEQDHDAIEVIVVDRVGQPRATSPIRAYFDEPKSRARFRRIACIEGFDGTPVQAINRGLKEISGDFVSVLQAGDELPVKRFSRLLTICHERSAQLAFSRVEPRIDGGGHRSGLGAAADYVYSVQDDVAFYPTVGYALLRSYCAVCTGNLFFSRELAGEVGEFEAFDSAYGWDFALRCLLLTEPVFVPEDLYVHRVSGPIALECCQQPESREKEAVLKRYLFACRNRRVANPVAPSPAWGPFFDSFLSESRYGGYLLKP
jgi:glycosyltransferase involved in cell wall biosynthesis